MATVRAYQGISLLDSFDFNGTPSFTISSTKVVVTAGNTQVTITGSDFEFGTSGVTGGTVSGIELKTDGEVAVEVLDLNMSLKSAAGLLIAGDIEGLLSKAFEGDDSFFGSNAADILFTFAGNDTLHLGGGDDVADGGSGIDTVVLDGLLSDYEFTTTESGAIKIVALDGPEGTDLVSNVEIVRFADDSEFDLTLLAADAWYKHDTDVELVASTYQFFTGSVPIALGFEYLIDSDQNPNDLNDPYYDQFNRENRYINFASNLGTDGAGADEFEATYGALSFEQTVKAAYLEIMGKALSGAALDFFLNAETFYQQVAEERVVRPGVDLDEATKIVAIGSILNESLKAGTGAYAEAVHVLVDDVAPDGQSDLLGQDLFAIA